MAPSSDFTALLVDWRTGDDAALEKLTPLVYQALRQIAARYMRSECSGHTLQTTALVNEAFVHLVDIDVGWQDRAHFFAVAATLMRRILVDHAKSKGRAKRGGGQDHLSLDEVAAVAQQPSESLLDLDEALTRLAEFDPRKGRIVELHFFGGMTYEETAEVLSISAATVDRELRLAKAWLHRALSETG